MDLKYKIIIPLGSLALLAASCRSSTTYSNGSANNNPQQSSTSYQQTTSTTPSPMPQMPTSSPAPSPQPLGTVKSTDPVPAPASTPVQPVSISISNFAFNPVTITIKAGTRVTWTNLDSAPHTITGDNGGPSSSQLLKGDSYTYSFTTPGTYNYHCSVHPNMKAVVVVTQ